MTASMTVLPVLGVPVESRALKGLDSLSVDRPDAGRRAGGDLRDRRGGRQERGLVRGRCAGAGRRRRRQAAEVVARPPDTLGRAQARTALRRKDARNRERIESAFRSARPGSNDRHSRRRPARPHAGARGGAPWLQGSRLLRRDRVLRVLCRRRHDARAVQRQARAGEIRGRVRRRHLRVRERARRDGAFSRRSCAGRAERAFARHRAGSLPGEELHCRARHRDSGIPARRQRGRGVDRLSRACGNECGTEGRPENAASRL